MYKLIISDLDGTLQGFGGAVSPAVKDAIHAAIQAGCRFTLATGRILQSVLPFAEDLQVNAPLICCSGALVIDHRTREELYKRTLPIPLVHEAMRYAMEAGLRCSAYFDDYTTSLRSPGDGRGFSEWLGDSANRPVPAPFEYLRREPMNCLLWEVNEDVTPLMVERLQERVGNQLRIVQTTPNLIECLLPDVSKAHAAAILSAHLGIPRGQVMALGDNNNDVELLKWAGLGVAVGSATPAARAAASHVVGPVSEDGAADALLRFILGAEPSAPARTR